MTSDEIKIKFLRVRGEDGVRVSPEPSVRRRRRKAKRVTVLYNIWMGREIRVDCVEVRSGTAIARRLGRKVRSFVKGLISAVSKLRRTGIQRPECAYEEPVFLDLAGGARDC